MDHTTPKIDKGVPIPTALNREVNVVGLWPPTDKMKPGETYIIYRPKQINLQSFRRDLYTICKKVTGKTPDLINIKIIPSVSSNAIIILKY